MRKKRKYGLFAKRGGQWVRLLPGFSYEKEQAVRVFQNALLAPALGEVPYEERELRPVKESEQGA